MKKNDYIILFIFIFLFAFSFIFPIYTQSSEAMSSPKYDIGYLQENDIIETHFTPSINKMNKLGISFATYAEVNKHGKLKLTLSQDGQLIKEEIIDLKNISDNEKYFIKFDEQENSNKKEYILKVSFDEYYDDISITMWGDFNSNKKNNIIKNNEPINRSMYLDIGGYSKNKNLIIYLIIAFLSWVIMICCKEGEKND